MATANGQHSESDSRTASGLLVNPGLTSGWRARTPVIGRLIRVSPEPASGLSAATGTLPAVFATILDRMARVNRASGARPARGPLRVTLRLTPKDVD